MGAEDQPLGFEDGALEPVTVSVASLAAGPLGVDHTLPRYVAALGQGVEGVADLPRRPGDAGELGDLAVGRDAALRDAPDDAVDAFVIAAGHGAEASAHPLGGAAQISKLRTRATTYSSMAAICSEVGSVNSTPIPFGRL